MEPKRQRLQTVMFLTFAQRNVDETFIGTYPRFAIVIDLDVASKSEEVALEIVGFHSNP